MQRYLFIIACLLCLNVNVIAQKKIALPHGMVYGSKPSTVALLPADSLETFMAKKARISTSVVGTVLRVTKSKGGWFDLDAGQGRIIKAHFKNYNINLPKDLKGREVIIQGVAAKQFIADDAQPMAGDTVVGKKQHKVNANPRQRLVFEVTGLMVNK